MAREVNMLFSLWRLSWGVIAFSAWPYNLVAGIYGAVEIAMGVAACWNALFAEQFDQRLVGWFLPFLYALGFVAIPVSDGRSEWLVPALICIAGFRVWCLIYLGSSYSAGCSTWNELADRGPYMLVRHPMELSSLLFRLVFCLSSSNWINWSGLALMVVASVGIVVIEEGFLRQREEWREYAVRVRWRLLPGVW